MWGREKGREEGYNNRVEWKQCGGGDGDEAPPREEEAMTTKGISEVEEGCAMGRGGARRGQYHDNLGGCKEEECRR